MDFNPHSRMQDLDAQFDINTSQVDNIEFDGIDTNDYPDFCDAYIVSADYKGVEMDEEDIDELNKNKDFVYEKLIQLLF